MKMYTSDPGNEHHPCLYNSSYNITLKDEEINSNLSGPKIIINDTPSQQSLLNIENG